MTATMARRASIGGVGDLYLRGKWNLLGDDGEISRSAFLFPYAKLPTASRSVGNGEVEEGLIVPIAFNLPGGWQLTIDPEADALADAAGGGRHLNLTTPLSLGYPVTKTITLFGELWGDIDFDPRRARFARRRSTLAAAWIPTKAPNLHSWTAASILASNRATPAPSSTWGCPGGFCNLLAWDLRPPARNGRMIDMTTAAPAIGAAFVASTVEVVEAFHRRCLLWRHSRELAPGATRAPAAALATLAMIVVALRSRAPTLCRFTSCRSWSACCCCCSGSAGCARRCCGYGWRPLALHDEEAIFVRETASSLVRWERAGRPGWLA